MLRTILAVLFAVCYLILGIPVLFVEWLIGKKNPHLRDISSLRMVQWAFRVIYRICGVKLTIIGQENVPKDTPVLYVANHNSYFDIIKDHIPFVKPTHVTIQYGTPVYPNELPKEEKRALGRYTQNIIQEMLEHEKAGSL